MLRICQLGAVCQRYCTHKWPHEPTLSLSCSQEGCSRAEMRTNYGMRDEFGEMFGKHTITPAYCVDFEYFLENTGHGHMIVTRGTVFEGYYQRVKEHTEKVEKENAIRFALEKEQRRQHRTDREMSWRYTEGVIRTEFNHSHNPSLIREEEVWSTGGNYRGWA